MNRAMALDRFVLAFSLSVACSVAFSVVGLADDAVPEAFLHRWEGMVTQTATFPLQYDVEGGAVGATVAAWELPSFSCGGPATLLEVRSEEEIVVTESVGFNGSGKCLDVPGNTARLQLLDGDSLLYDYSDPDGARVQGTLWRVQAEFTVAGPDAGGAISVDAGPSAPHAGTTLTEYAWDFGDGESGTGVQATNTYAWPGRYLVRLAVTNDAFRTDAAERTVSYACPTGDVAPWASLDVGEPALPGAAGWLAGSGGSCLEVCAGGRDISGRSDQFHFVEQTVPGDLVLTARLSSLDGESPSSWKAGLMVREDSSPGSRHAAVCVRKGPGLAPRPIFLVRDAAGGTTRSFPGDADLALPDVWLRIERRGETVVGSYSGDGAAWTEIGTATLPGPGGAPLQAGLAACEADLGATPFRALRAEFCEVDLRPGLGTDFLRGDADDSGDLVVTDAIFVLNYLFAGGMEPSCMDAADANNDGAVDLSDPILVLGYLFLGMGQGEGPKDRVGSCHAGDSIEDFLTCASYSGCR